MRMFLSLLCVLCVLTLSPAYAIGIDAPRDDASKEARAQHLFASLRCVVCSGQTLADSDVALARDMRTHVRKMIDSGARDAEILSYFTERYGTQVLTIPPNHGAASLLWVLPLVLLLCGIFLLRRVMRSTHI